MLDLLSIFGDEGSIFRPSYLCYTKYKIPFSISKLSLNSNSKQKDKFGTFKYLFLWSLIICLSLIGFGSLKDPGSKNNDFFY